MSCPKCNSTDLWDDNFWWGCNQCDFMQHGGFTVTLVRDPNYVRDEDSDDNGYF